jgi:sporulation protein YlmC with PRC-barrel domain
MPDGPRRVVPASTLVGDPVRNEAGETLGEIREIMLDVRTGRVAYAVLGFGGFLGMGDKLFAVPWPALRHHEREHAFVLGVSRETLRRAPGFDKDRWPDFADPAWSASVHEHYDVKP